ncbi:MAG: hypothetical protein QM691_09395 [Opitutaceae bacterium]
MTLPPEKAWWPRKTVGYGWAWPRRWPGVVATIAYCAAMAGGGIWAAETQHIGRFLIGAFGATAVLIALCHWKGENPG